MDKYVHSFTPGRVKVRPRCKVIAHWLERLAHHIYPVPLSTVQISTELGTYTFTDARFHSFYRRDPEISKATDSSGNMLNVNRSNNEH